MQKITLLVRMFVCIVLVMVSSCAPKATHEDSREILTCFTPGENCTQFVVDAIKLGDHEILVQAYNFTSPAILEALAHLKNAGVDVKVILDKSNEQDRYTGATYEKNHNVPVWIDDRVAIAHNKVIVIDGKHVLTGSFNFTDAAQKKNAENVILIKNDQSIANRYRDYWNSRQRVSREFVRKQ